MRYQTVDGELRSMQEQSLYTYIWLGTSIRFLIDVVDEATFHEFEKENDGFILFNLEELHKALVQHGLSVTQSHFGMHGMSNFVLELRQRVKDSSESSGYLNLSKDESARLRELARSLRLTLDAEASKSVAYVAHDRRYSAKVLLDNIAELLTEGAFDDLPDIAQYDFREAGRAIAFDLPTAAGFHLMRCTEAALRHYYERLVKRNRLSNPMWGPMVSALRAKKQKPPPEHLLDHLDSIRRNFRNPTQHPEKIYDLEEAQDLLALCADAVSRMYRDSADRVGRT